MCLYTDQKTPRVSKRDRIVYKVLNRSESTGTLTSPWFRKRWTIGRRHAAKRFYSRANGAVHDGLHAYTSEIVAKMNRSVFDVVTRARIPKGSKYYLGSGKHSGKQIAASHMIIEKVL